MKKIIILSLLVFFSAALFAQKDTVVVPGYYEAQQYGTLNDAIEKAINEGTINNTVFKLNPYEVYVLSRSIFLDKGQNLEIVAPKPGNTQESAPPQIVWTEEGIDRAYLIQSYGDIVMKNVWVRYADFLGNKVSSSIVFENQEDANDPEVGIFDGCIFDYAGIGAEAGGAITVKANHFVGKFYNSYWRNNSDNHFRYYGRAISFPYQSSGWHYDTLLFENCSFTNLSRIIMQEGNEYSDNVYINHCTLLNSVEWVFQSAGWLRNAAITNSLFVNPMMIGYRAVDVCPEGMTYDDFKNGLCNSPGGGLINGLTPVDSFGFAVDFTDFDRKLFIGNVAYLYQDFYLKWFTEAPSAKERIRNRESDLIYNPSPMLGQDEIDFIDSVDAEGNKVFKTMNVDWETIYSEDPQFIEPATNQEALLTFMDYKWSNNADIDWSYRPDAGFNQTWPLPENLAYTNEKYKTAAMGGFPLGDLNWFPDIKPAWEAQRDQEWKIINNWLNYGSPNPVSVRELNGKVPTEYRLKQNYPNPFNPTTNIEYSVPKEGYVSIKIFNVLGQQIATLFEGNQKAGNYVITFDASNLPSGVYLYSLETDNITLTKKLMLMK
ncbi:T9SS type A sorting domain-containing protein [Melioribacter sp. OK-6-Me]|uniref:T9SS type A sorting domain-containing protein n=1 Tax=unclassified Melioribacter TaxID=2627329 RepID=UPI003EDA8F58